MHKFTFFGIDLQNAFTKDGHPLCVPGAVDDTKRAAAFVTTNAARIENIVLTMDTHVVDHIGHPGYWKTADGSEPAPFTLITLEALETGALAPKNPVQIGYVKKYIAKLGPSMIWPVHCVPGTESHEINANFGAAMAAWHEATLRTPVIVQKGYQKNTESFGVFAAEYDDGDFGVDFNTHLAAVLMHGNRPVVIAGEALSHCVRRSVEQFIDYLDNQFGQHSWPFPVLVLRDTTSPVPGFEAQAEEFVAAATERGVRFCTTVDFDAALVA